MWQQIVGYALKAGGSLLSAYGGLQASKEAEGVAKYNAKVELDKGKAEKRSKDMQNKIKQDADRGKLSESTALGGIRGIIMSSGSALMSETKQYSDMVADHTEISRQGEVARITGENKAELYKRQARSIHKARYWNMAGTLMGGMS